MLFTVRRIIALQRKPSKKSSKIFVIGMNKTGTSSLGEALRILGYDHFSTFYNKWPQLHYIIWQRLKWKGFFVWLASKYDSFDDSPGYNPSIIRLVDEKFPGSKFILLHRSKESYVNSYLTYFALFPEVPTLSDPDEIYDEYLNHQKACLDYFADKEEKLLFLSVSESQGFKKLGDFLGHEVPQENLPHMNKTSSIASEN